MCLGFCADAALCCAGQLCCACLCAPAKALGATPRTYARIGYVFFQIFWVVTVIITMYIGSWAVSGTSWLGIECTEQSGGNDACFGASLLVRLSFSLACTHFIVFLVTLARNQGASAFHDGCWMVKILMTLGILILSMWIPNDPFFTGYLEFAGWVSFAFLCFQAILMLEVAYRFNDALISNVNNEDGAAMSCSGIILIGLTLSLFVGNVIWIWIMFDSFSGCPFNVWQMCFTTVMGVLMYALVLVRTRDDASIFTSSLVLTYNLYLQWSALSSKPKAECNPYIKSAGNTSFEIIMGLVFTFFALLVISSQSVKQEDDALSTGINAPMMEKEDKEEERKTLEEGRKVAVEGQKENGSHVFPISSATIIFQGLLVLASVYYAMLLTNWGTPTLFDESTYDFFNKNTQSFWIQLTAQWISMLIYVFSMIAPIIFPDRF